MGIRTTCPNGHALNLKAFLAGRTGICPHCGARFVIPREPSEHTGVNSDQPLAVPHDADIDRHHGDAGGPAAHPHPDVPIADHRLPTIVATPTRSGRDRLRATRGRVPVRPSNRLARRVTIVTILIIVSIVLFVVLAWRVGKS